MLGGRHCCQPLRHPLGTHKQLWPQTKLKLSKSSTCFEAEAQVAMKLSQTEPLLWDQKMHYKIPDFSRRAARFKQKAREITTAKCVCVCMRACGRACASVGLLKRRKTCTCLCHLTGSDKAGAHGIHSPPCATRLPL